MDRFLTAISRRNLMSLLLISVLAVECLLLKLDSPLDALDMKILYPPAKIADVLAAQGPLGRRVYFLAECIDVFFAMLYSLLFLALGARARRRRQLSIGEWNWGWIPLLVPGTCDVVESAGILTLLMWYPESRLGLARMVSVATTLKWATLVLVALFLTREWRRGRYVVTE